MTGRVATKQITFRLEAKLSDAFDAYLDELNAGRRTSVGKSEALQGILDFVVTERPDWEHVRPVPKPRGKSK